MRARLLRLVERSAAVYGVTLVGVVMMLGLTVRVFNLTDDANALPVWAQFVVGAVTGALGVAVAWRVEAAHDRAVMKVRRA